MNVRVHHLGLAFLAMLAVAVLLPQAALAASEFSLIDQGWQVVEQDGKRSIEVSAMVINESQASLEYEVRFIVERAESMPDAAASGTSATEAVEPAEPVWSVVRTASVHGGPLAPDASEVATAALPYEVLEAGKAHRFRSELCDAAPGADGGPGPVVADAVLTSLGQPFAVAGTMARFAPPAAGSAALLARVPLPRTDVTESPGDRMLLAAAAISGSGTMSGSHDTLRVGGQWVENGHGTITIKAKGFSMFIYYWYDAVGPDAGNLTATLDTLKTYGTYYSKDSPTSQPVKFSSASAWMTRAGPRHESGSVITRTACSAAGEFVGLVGGNPWSGTLTLFGGKMDLDMSTTPYRGAHRFKVKFDAGEMSVP